MPDAWRSVTESRQGMLGNFYCSVVLRAVWPHSRPCLVQRFYLEVPLVP